MKEEEVAQNCRYVVDDDKENKNKEIGSCFSWKTLKREHDDDGEMELYKFCKGIFAVYVTVHFTYLLIEKFTLRIRKKKSNKMRRKQT